MFTKFSFFAKKNNEITLINISAVIDFEKSVFNIPNKIYDTNGAKVINKIIKRLSLLGME